MVKHTSSTLTCNLVISNTIIALHDSLAIFVAKAFNSSISQIMTPSLACTSMPAASLDSLWKQSVFCASLFVVILHVMIKVLSTSSEYKPTIIVMVKHILAWSFKELTSIFIAMIARVIAERNIIVEDRYLRDYFQGDAEYKKELAWFIVAAYAIYTVFMFLVAYILFVPALKIMRGAFWHVMSLLFKAPWTPKRKLLMERDNNEQLDEEDSKNFGSNNNCLGCKPIIDPFYREESDKTSDALSNECIRTAYAYCMNGSISGFLLLFFSNNDGFVNETAIFAFGLFEVYCILTCIIGGLIFSSKRMMKEDKFGALRAFYWQWWATWAGLAIATLGSGPGSVSSLIENSPLSSELSKFLRAVITTLFAAFLIFIGSDIHATRKVMKCIDVSENVASKIGDLLITASVLGIGVTWEELGGDSICTLAAEEDKTGISPVAIKWIYFAISFFLIFPLAIPIGIHGRKRVTQSKQDLVVFHENFTSGDEES